MAEKRRLPVLQNTDDEVAHRPAWQGAAIVASLSVLLWVVVFALVSAAFRRWAAAPLVVVVVTYLMTSAIACAGATGIARVAVPAMRARLAAAGAVGGTLFVFVVATWQTLRGDGGGGAIAQIAATFALLSLCNGAAAFAFARVLERRAARGLLDKKKK